MHSKIVGLRLDLGVFLSSITNSTPTFSKESRLSSLMFAKSLLKSNKKESMSIFIAKGGLRNVAQIYSTRRHLIGVLPCLCPAIFFVLRNTQSDPVGIIMFVMIIKVTAVVG
jgi:hypothetical protein